MRRVAGIDVGGTFTDLLLLETGEGGDTVRLAKVPTTVANQADGVMAAIAASGTAARDLDLIVHGTTTTTNAVLERKTAKVALVTTKGFRDVLELGRRTRPQSYGMTGQFEPLIPRDLRFEVAERMLADGTVHTPLDEAGLTALLKQIAATGAEALVIHFLHAYANPAHEIRARDIARQIWPNGYITTGHELLSEFREYERGTTASVNAAVQPILDRYVARLQTALEGEDYGRDLLVMNGNGGTVSARVVAREAAKTVMSGPASGVIAAAATLKQAKIANAITYDMGGTSTDVALIHGGIPEVSSELQIDYGLPIHVPMVDVRTVGAGGGSIGWIDKAGILRVGPESAGASPGPICYARGGDRPTVTDANMLLGRLNPERLLAVDAPVSLDHIRSVFARDLADPLGISPEDAAEAMVRIANINMAGAIRMVSLSRGHDPRDFVLFAFGGAGPLHAAALARELSIPRVLVPARPGLTNALGCLVADLRQDRVNTLNRLLDDLDMAEVKATLEAQREEAMAINAEEASEIETTEVIHSADMQFKGQTHLIRVAIPSPDISKADLQARFEDAYFRRFEVSLPEIRAVLVNLNTAVIGHRRAMDLKGLMTGAEPAASLAEAKVGERRLCSAGQFAAAPIYARDRLPSNCAIAGPAIVEQLDTTVYIPAGATARPDAIGNLVIEVTS